MVVEAAAVATEAAAILAFRNCKLCRNCSAMDEVGLRTSGDAREGEEDDDGGAPEVLTLMRLVID